MTSKQRIALYATTGDFCRIFREDMESLYLLSLVLTADPQKAEQSFVAGLDDSTAGNWVFKEWARSWARRVVIKNAIRAIAPDAAFEKTSKTRNGEGAALLQEFNQPQLPAELVALSQLPSLERFAFVMSACEGYADHDSALLLGCTREEFAAARTRAFGRLKDLAPVRGEFETVAALKSGNDAMAESLAIPA